MEIIQGYKTELDLNNRQGTCCLQHAGVARWAYNYGLARKQDVYAQRTAAADPQSVKIPTAIDLHNEIIALKQGEKPWLKEVSKWTPQQVLRNLDVAFDRFLKKQARYPQFKKRSTGIGSFYVEAPIHVGVDWIQVPVLGKVRLFEHGYIPQDRDLDKPDRKAAKKRAKHQRDTYVLIKYKSAVISEHGNLLYLANPFFPSTQLCSHCHRLPSVYLDLSIPTYHCEHCGLVLDRDLNAARNLKWLYTASSAEIDACGEIVSPKVLALRAVSLKQEPNAR